MCCEEFVISVCDKCVMKSVSVIKSVYGKEGVMKSVSVIKSVYGKEGVMKSVLCRVSDEVCVMKSV